MWSKWYKEAKQHVYTWNVQKFNKKIHLSQNKNFPTYANTCKIWLYDFFGE